MTKSKQMATLTKAKWFYPAQDKIKAFLNERFGDNYSCNFQDVCREAVYENYVVNKPGEFPTYVQFVIHPGATPNRPSIIQTFWYKHEDTMQYFPREIKTQP